MHQRNATIKIKLLYVHYRLTSLNVNHSSNNIGYWRSIKIGFSAAGICR